MGYALFLLAAQLWNSRDERRMNQREIAASVLTASWPQVPPHTVTSAVFFVLFLRPYQPGNEEGFSAGWKGDPRFRVPVNRSVRKSKSVTAQRHSPSVFVADHLCSR